MHNTHRRMVTKTSVAMLLIAVLWIWVGWMRAQAGVQEQTIPTMPPPTTAVATNAPSDTPDSTEAPSATALVFTQVPASWTPEPTTFSTVGPTGVTASVGAPGAGATPTAEATIAQATGAAGPLGESGGLATPGAPDVEETQEKTPRGSGWVAGTALVLGLGLVVGVGVWLVMHRQGRVGG